MSADLVEVLTQGPAVSVYLGQVTEVRADNTLTLAVGGGTLPGVPRLRSYADPAVGDVVYVLSTGRGSAVVIGAEATRPAATSPTVPVGQTLAEPVAAGTFDRKLGTWVSGEVHQDSGHAGAFFYSLSDLGVLLAVPVAAVEILLRVDADSAPLGLTLVSNTGPTGVFSPVAPTHLQQVQPGGAWVRLPIAWMAPLANGRAAGVGFISNTDTARSVSGGTLRVTPL